VPYPSMQLSGFRRRECGRRVGCPWLSVKEKTTGSWIALQLPNALCLCFQRRATTDDLTRSNPSSIFAVALTGYMEKEKED